MISKGNHVTFARFVLLGISEEAKTWLLSSTVESTVRHWCNKCFVFDFFQFFAHPVINDLMTEKWHGQLGGMKKCSWLSTERWTWVFLNIWCLLDSVLFPLLFIVFGGYQFIKKKIRNRKSKFEFKQFFLARKVLLPTLLCVIWHYSSRKWKLNRK